MLADSLTAYPYIRIMFERSGYFAIIGLIALLACHKSENSGLYFGQGVMVGEVTHQQAIFQTRLTKVDSLLAGEVPGDVGFVRFVYQPKDLSDQEMNSRWLPASPIHDYIVKYVAGQLQPNTIYHYRVEAVRDTTKSIDQQMMGYFKTLPGPAVNDTISMVVVTGMNYYFFYYGQYDKTTAYQGPDKKEGYPALQSIRKLAPDYFIGTGDNVYFDHPAIKGFTQAVERGRDPHEGLFEGREVTGEKGMRRKYHVQFVQPRFKQLFSRVGTYWLKDDHDYRVNDADPYIEFPISHDLGIKNFREQLPVVDPGLKESVTYRTHRFCKELQLWFLEGRDYRSANRSPDGPEKTLWGEEQKQWLKSTLLESDANYKLIISPTPMVGPDDASKRDNHVNPRGFRHEGEAFFQWLNEQELSQDSVFVICGDRHWQYHARHPSGFEEFSCGALVDANSRAGRRSGDPKSTDPEALIRQFYIQGHKKDATGGFLNVIYLPGPTSGRLQFSFYDEQGSLKYQTIK